MAGVMLAPNWPDLMEPGFRKVYTNRFKAMPVMVPTVFNVVKTTDGYERVTDVSPVPDHSVFTGKASVVEPIQGYDKTFTWEEYTAMIMIQRKLASDDRYGVVSKYPGQLGDSAARSREKLGSNAFNLMFTAEPTDGDTTELCASDHPSPVAGVDTQSNEGTTALSAGGVESTRLSMFDFFDYNGELIPVNPDSFMIPRALEQTGWEIVNTKGKVDTAENNANFHQGKYKLIVWDRMTDTNNWAMMDWTMRGDMLDWYNREPVQFFQDRDSDTLVAKYLSYYRCGLGWTGWQFLFGQLVS